MERSNILYAIQKKLIQNLSLVVNDVKEEYKSKLNNSWVLECLNQIVENLTPTNLATLNYNKGNLENALKKVINEKFNGAKKILALRDEETYNLANVLGNLYALICSRTKAEFSGLESKILKYNSPEQLVKAEFDKSKAFNSKEEHQRWLTNFLDNLELIFNYIEEKAQTLTQKKDFRGKAKLMAAKLYLRTNGMNLNSKKLPEDISMIKKAILDNYQKYEQRLIKSRYHEQEVLI